MDVYTHILDLDCVSKIGRDAKKVCKTGSARKIGENAENR